MEIPLKEKIENLISKNKLEDALDVIKEASGEHQFKEFQNQVLTLLTKNMDLKRNKNQTFESDYEVKKERLLNDILELKDKLINAIKDPDAYREMEAAREEAKEKLERNTTANHQIPKSPRSDDWYKIVTNILLALFGFAVISFITMGGEEAEFRTISSASMFAMTMGAKIIDRVLLLKAGQAPLVGG